MVLGGRVSRFDSDRRGDLCQPAASRTTLILLLPVWGPGGGHGRRTAQPSPSLLVVGTDGLGYSCGDRTVQAVDQPRTFSGLRWAIQEGGLR